MKSKQDIATQFKRHLNVTKKGLSEQYDNTITCQQFYAGDTMSYQDKIGFIDAQGQRKRAMVQFNKVKPNVDAVSGFMSQNRQQAKYLARINQEPVQQLFSRYSNSLKDYVRENQNADQIESQQDHDMLIGGYGATDTDMSYIAGNATKDPNGEILKVRLDPRCVGWDPTAKAKNLTESRWAYYWEDYDIDEALDLFMDSDEEDFEAITESPAETSYQYNPYGGRYDKIREQISVEWVNEQEKRVRVYNYQWFEYETFYRAKNPLFLSSDPYVVSRFQMELELISHEIETTRKENDYGDMFDFDYRQETLTFDAETKAKLVKAFGTAIKPHAFKRKAFYTCVISGSHVFTCFRSIHQQAFSIQFKTGFFDANRRIWIGMVNSMMEPAKYYNKALTEFMFTIASNSKGGVMVERTAIEDVADFEKKYAKTDAVIVVNDGALTKCQIQPKDKPLTDSGLSNLIQLTDAAISDTSGVDPSFLGSAENKQETGILFKRRIRQIISTMANYMDSVTLYAKCDARLLLDFLRVWATNNDGEIFRIIGQDGKDQYAQISADKFAAQYDVTIQEAPQTPEDKEETATLISDMGDKLLQVGDAVTAKALYIVGLDFLNIDGDARQRMVEALQPKQPQIDPRAVQALQQELEQAKSKIVQADVENKQSETALNVQKIAESKANSHLKTTQSAKTLEEAQRTDVETALLRKQKPEVQANI